MNPQPEKRLSRRTATGAGTLVASRLITRSIDLAALLVLGRLLSSADFGVVAIAMTLIYIIEAMLELPVSMALIRMPNLAPAHIDTAFTLGVLRGLAVALIVGLAAWPFAELYNNPHLFSLICALGLAPVMRGLQSPRMFLYAQRLEFRQELAMDVAGKIAAFAVSISLALSLKSYWAIAAGTIAAPAVMAAASYVLAPYKPRFTMGEWRSFSGFLGWTTAGQAVTAVNWQMAQLFLGKFVSVLQVGHFAMASTIVSLPAQIIGGQTARPLLAAFSLIRSDDERLRSAYLLSTAAVLTICIPMMLGLSVLAEPLFRLALGEKWSPAGGILEWLAIAALLSMFTTAFGPLAMALNRTDFFVRLSLIEFVIKLPVMFFGAREYGVYGAVTAQLVSAFFLMVASMFAVKSLAQLPVRRQILDPWRPILSGLTMATCLVPLGPWLQGLKGVYLLCGLSATILLGAIVYAGSILLLWRLAGRPSGVESKIVALLETQIQSLLRKARR